MSKLIGPLNFVSEFKANVLTQKNDQRLKINLNLQVCYQYGKESVRKNTEDPGFDQPSYGEKDRRNLFSGFSVEIQNLA